jgi:hypothetical protein
MKMRRNGEDYSQGDCCISADHLTIGKKDYDAMT